MTGDVLLLKDCDPYGTTAVEDALAELGASHDVVESSALSETDLSTYSTLVVPSSQPDAYYEALAGDGATNGSVCGPVTDTARFEGTLGSDEVGYHSYDVAGDPCRVELSLSGTGDLDLYVTLDGREPTRSDYDLRSRTGGSEESIVVDGEQLGSEARVEIAVRSYAGRGEYDLVVERRRTAESPVAGFVAGGGRLVAHVSTTGGTCSATREHQFLPGEATIASGERDGETIARPSHPLVEGVSESALDAELSARARVDPPDDGTVVVESEGEPTVVTYGYGDGSVVATGLAVERAFSGGDHDAAARLLHNELSGPLETTRTVSTSVTTLSLFPGNDETPPDGDPLNGSLPNVGGMAVDAWFYGDMVHELEEEVDADGHYDKRLPTYPGENFRRYRFKNSLEVAFETPDGESVDPDRVTVTGNDDEAASYVCLVDQGPGRLTRFWVEQVLFGTDVEKRRRATLQDSYDEYERVEIDGVEGVRAARIYGGFDPYVEDMLHTVIDLGVDVFFGILGMAPVEELIAYLSATPSIYTFVETTLLADGTRLVRVWDASRYPRHAGYLDGTKRDTNDFEHGQEWTAGEFWNDRFSEWTQEAQSQVFSPYGASALGYESFFDGGYGPHPVMLYGEGPDGEDLSDDEIEKMLPEEPLVPL